VRVSQLTWVTEAVLSTLGGKWVLGRDRIVSYLPLSHIAGMVVTICIKKSVVSNGLL